MKLYVSLSEEEQSAAVQYCADIVITDLLETGVKLDPVNTDEEALRDKLEIAVEKMKDFETKQEKVDFLMADPDVSTVILQIAEEMARNIYYSDIGELVISVDELSDGEEIETADDLVEGIRDNKVFKKSELN
jgi:hypothetical protein